MKHSSAQSEQICLAQHEAVLSNAQQIPKLVENRSVQRQVMESSAAAGFIKRVTNSGRGLPVSTLLNRGTYTIHLNIYIISYTIHLNIHILLEILHLNADMEFVRDALIVSMFKGIVRQLSKCSCICRLCSALYCTISAVCIAALYAAQCTKQCWNIVTRGLTLLLPGSHFAPAGVSLCSCRGVNLLLLGSDFAPAGV